MQEAHFVTAIYWWRIAFFLCRALEDLLFSANTMTEKTHIAIRHSLRAWKDLGIV
jgi:hypothetical protein